MKSATLIAVQSAALMPAGGRCTVPSHSSHHINHKNKHLRVPTVPLWLCPTCQIHETIDNQVLGKIKKPRKKKRKT
jgi:hypothetical protein